MQLYNLLFFERMVTFEDDTAFFELMQVFFQKLVSIIHYKGAAIPTCTLASKDSTISPISLQCHPGWQQQHRRQLPI
jgi:hypothetical protein